MNFLKKKRFFAILLLIILLILFYKSTWLARFIYPIHYRSEIAANASKFGVDPLLAAAVMRVESNYKADSLSHKGALGIMQIMPDTAEWILGMDGFRSYKMKDLNDPALNISVGIKYLSILGKQFGGNQAEVIAAYNAGPGKVDGWRQTGSWDGTFEDAERIPYAETRKYVHSVNYYYKIYKQIYEGEFKALPLEKKRRTSLPAGHGASMASLLRLEGNYFI